jgi:hypothetical protein
MKAINSIVFIAIAILLMVNSVCIKYCDNCRRGGGGTESPCDTCQFLLPPPSPPPPNFYTN